MRRRSKRNRGPGLRWALSTVAPWALSAGMLISFTASAGQNHDDPGVPASPIARLAPGPLSALAEGPSVLVAASAFHLPQEVFRRASQPPRSDAALANPFPPREDMKRTAAGFPRVERAGKGDQLPALRPSLSRATPPTELASVVFGAPQDGLISGGFSMEAAEGYDGPQVGFEPIVPDQGLTDPALSDASPAAVPHVFSTARQAELTLESMDGSTPFVSDRSAQSSTTPASGGANATLASLTPSPFGAEPPAPNGSLVAKVPAPRPTDLRLAAPGERQSYAGLIAPAAMAKEQRCLAEAVYFEARSESDKGRAAVAQVVLNRVKSGLYPNTVCGTVYQNRNRHLACQFTFACEGKALRITEPGPWRDAVRIAREVYEGTTYLADVGASTHYHADYVRPQWSRKLKKMDTIGRHVFYKLRPGQT
ncbi:cell wall hydrolase [Bosea sp. TWI1241]|uniref:cell wall hydrolase n=1 Tax=Bosea sp. TWI1241 TaxID=3148904 RepID=UPI0032081C16